MREKIQEWIKGLVEDDPIPYEIKYLYFLIVEDKNSFHLEFAGCELKSENLDYFPYYPLEGQYCILDYKKDETDFINELYLIIDSLFLDEQFNRIFLNKIVFIAKMYEKVYFEIKN